MTNLYIHIYISTRLYLTPGFSIRTRSGRGIRLVRISKYTETRVCAFQIIGKTPPPFSFRFVRVKFVNIQLRSKEFLRVPPLFTSSSRWNERIHPSLPHSSMRTRERFLLSTVIYTRWSCRKSSFRRIPPEGGCSTVVQISRFIFFSLFSSPPLVFVCRENSRITAIVENVISEWRWFKRIFDGFYKLVKLAPSNLFSLPLRTVFNRKFISPVLEGGRFTVLN